MFAVSHRLSNTLHIPSRKWTYVPHKKGPVQKEISSSHHRFSVDVSFQGSKVSEVAQNLGTFYKTHHLLEVFLSIFFGLGP